MADRPLSLWCTPDLTISPFPEPGSDILSKIIEIKSLTAALQEGFGSPDATLPWAQFNLIPSQVTRTSYPTLAAQYGTVIDPPPTDSLPIVKSLSKNWENKDQAKKDEYTSFDIEIPDGYEVSGVSAWWQRWAWEDEAYHFDIQTDFNQWLGAGGKLTLTVGTRYVSAFDFELTITVNLSDASYKAWQMRVWGRAA